MSYFMGIDLGTSSTKTLIMEENGKTAGIGNASYGIQIPQISYAEQDPLEWWEAVKKSIKKALQEARIQGRDIAGIGFSGQMHGMVALDENKQLACKAIIHLDQRSSLELKEIRTLAGKSDDRGAFKPAKCRDDDQQSVLAQKASEGNL